VLDPGDLLLSCGTSWVGFYPVRERDGVMGLGLLVDPFLSPGGPWATLFALTAVGITIERHLERFVSPGSSAADRYRSFNALAAATPPGADGLVIDIYRDRSAYLDDVDPSLSAYPPAQVARALMEGPAFETRMKVEELAALGLAARRIVMVGGPTQSPVWPRIVAEVMGHDLTVTNGQVAGAMGAAILSAIGAGVYRNEAEAFRGMGGEGTGIEPDPGAVRVYGDLYQAYRGRKARS
jgi:sugar (pentulose or hexulose) kinase